jgi:hypothetical protein
LPQIFFGHLNAWGSFPLRGQIPAPAKVPGFSD